MVGCGIRLPIPHIFIVIKVNLYITDKAGSFAFEQNIFFFFFLKSYFEFTLDQIKKRKFQRRKKLHELFNRVQNVICEKLTCHFRILGSLVVLL